MPATGKRASYSKIPDKASPFAASLRALQGRSARPAGRAQIAVIVMRVSRKGLNLVRSSGP